MFYRIINTEPTFPSSFSRPAVDCLRGLLRVNEADRLGSGDNGAEDLKKTAFFSSIDFEALFRKEIAAPFQPEVSNELDTKYVPKAYLQAEAKDSIAEAPKRGDPNANFEAFTFSGNIID